MTYWYLASPYSKYPGGLDAAWKLACRATAEIIAAGGKVFSPIAHSHGVAVHGNLDPLAHDIWLPADAPLMAAAKGLVVLCVTGWQESFGIAEEIKAFTAAGKPILYMDDTVPAEMLA